MSSSFHKNVFSENINQKPKHVIVWHITESPEALKIKFYFFVHFDDNVNNVESNFLCHKRILVCIWIRQMPFVKFNHRICTDQYAPQQEGQMLRFVLNGIFNLSKNVAHIAKNYTNVFQEPWQRAEVGDFTQISVRKTRFKIAKYEIGLFRGAPPCSLSNF